MRLAAYLERLGVNEILPPNAATLAKLHRAHLLAIPYENLDIHLGRSLTLDLAAIFDKLVVQRRGGWCYEMNALFAWALRELGFKVRLLGGAVNRQQRGDVTRRSHLALLVELERHYLADVGFGNGFLVPLHLQEGQVTQGFLSYRLEKLDCGWWRFHNHAYGGPSFDFSLEPHLLEDFAEQCHELQTSQASGFVRLTVCHRFTGDGVVSLRGAEFTTVRQAGQTKLVLTSAAAYGRVLERTFGLTLPEVDRLWHKVWAGHQAWLASQGRA